MVTVFLLAITFCVLFILVFDDASAGLPGFFAGLLLGLVVAALIGNSFPTKTINIVSEPIEQLPVVSAEGYAFYLQKDEGKNLYSYMVKGEIRTLNFNEADPVYESGVPFIEYSRTELALPKGQGWKRWFGTTNLPREDIVIHLPQGSMYLIQSNKKSN